MRGSLLLLALLPACAAAPSASPAPPPPRDVRPLGADMNDHFGDLRGVELALILGRPYDVRLRALLLADLETPPDHVAQEHWVERIRRGARAIVATPDLGRASVELTAMATGCAGCHVETGAAAVIERPLGPAPLDDGSVAARMAVHRWAADRLWDGVVTPARGPWQEGLRRLAATPMTGAELVADPARREEAARLAERLAAQATAAGRLPRDARPRAFAELLATCAACHAIARP